MINDKNNVNAKDIVNFTKNMNNKRRLLKD
jgi:hypothetical protein